jgi:hypothetical protein
MKSFHVAHYSGTVFCAVNRPVYQIKGTTVKIQYPARTKLGLIVAVLKSEMIEHVTCSNSESFS